MDIPISDEGTSPQGFVCQDVLRPTDLYWKCHVTPAMKCVMYNGYIVYTRITTIRQLVFDR